MSNRIKTNSFCPNNVLVEVSDNNLHEIDFDDLKNCTECNYILGGDNRFLCGWSCKEINSMLLLINPE